MKKFLIILLILAMVLSHGVTAFADEDKDDMDLNLDRKFDEKDSLKDYNLFCIESPVSFSCANLVPCVFKNSNKVTLLGRPSSGGACVISRMTTADGCLFNMSGIKRLAYMKNGSFYDID